MKITVNANQKGGVGKTFLEVQLAYFFALQRSKRTLVLDFDHQGNTSKAIEKGKYAQVSRVKASQIFTGDAVQIVEPAPFVLVPADREVRCTVNDGHSCFKPPAAVC